VAEVLVALNTDIINKDLYPITVEESEKGIEKGLATVLWPDANSTLAWAAQHPTLVVERVRRFLLHCVAQDHDLTHLVPLSQADQEHFKDLVTFYRQSLEHQIVYGWTTTTPQVKLRVSEVFLLFMENPMRCLAFKFTTFIYGFIRYQGSAIFDEKGEHKPLTIQALRRKGRLNKLESTLRSNSRILDAIAVRENEGFVLL
jgi:hypothetical protein